LGLDDHQDGWVMGAIRREIENIFLDGTFFPPRTSPQHESNRIESIMMMMMITQIRSSVYSTEYSTTESVNIFSLLVAAVAIVLFSAVHNRYTVTSKIINCISLATQHEFLQSTVIN
jgi:hypothetical protein